ncbi:hypothetical protein DFS34DRAFT_610057 [Phlyctochytrium arcticum]|nr:hypothetical protein DFS34DRAFT_610057 [Phlyctochytrium arcticum]
MAVGPFFEPSILLLFPPPFKSVILCFSRPMLYCFSHPYIFILSSNYQTFSYFRSSFHLHPNLNLFFSASPVRCSICFFLFPLYFLNCSTLTQGFFHFPSILADFCPEMYLLISVCPGTDSSSTSILSFLSTSFTAFPALFLLTLL